SSMSYHSQSSVVQAFRKEEIKNLINTWQAGDSPITKQTQKNITAKQMDVENVFNEIGMILRAD
ncbi:MAG: hypothetical protein ACHQ1D_12000, partial [Nitrososphaerales archaeon]